LLVAVGFLIAFIWSVKDGQYDDDYTPSIRMLFDSSITKKKDEPKIVKTKEKSIEIK